MRTEHKQITIEEVKVSSSVEGQFTGYGAVFGNIDSYGDAIAKGAFKDTLREWEGKGKYPPMLLQHGGGMFGGTAEDMLPIGKWLAMEENNKGLKVTGQLIGMKTERVQLVYEGLKEGVLDGLSIGYQTKKFTAGTKPGEPKRTLTAIDLWELSVVTFPANGKARVAQVKSMIDEMASLADAEKVLREAGFSRKEALDFVSCLSKIARREADSDPLAGLVKELRSINQSVFTKA